MLFNQDHNFHISDTESTSSLTSNATSRATLFPNSWSQSTLQHQNEIKPLNIQMINDDIVSNPSTSTETVSTVVNQKPDISKINNNQPNANNIQNQQQQQQQAWVNPYWGADWKPDTAPTSAGINKGNSPVATRVEQLIPGSILINDNGEIDDASWKRAAGPISTRSDSSFNPGGKYVSDGSGGAGGYLAPIHIQRRTASVSSGLASHPENEFDYNQSRSVSDITTGIPSTFNQQQNFPERSPNNSQPSINSYQSNSNQINSQLTEKPTTVQSQTPQLPTDSKQNTWANPYWDKASPEKPTPSTGTWANPYWDKPPAEKPTPPTGNLANPYWDKPPAEKPTPPTGNFTNPYWDKPPSEKPTPSTEKWTSPYGDKAPPEKPTPSTEKWASPYGDKAPPEKLASSTEPWVNPYWGKKSPEKPTPSTRTWQNPYWKDWQPQSSTTSNQQQDISRQNSYLKKNNTPNQGIRSAALNNSLSFEYKVPPIPSYYVRIYPPYTSTSSSMPIKNTSHGSTFSNKTSKQNFNDDDDLPYTIDSQGVAHYRATSPSVILTDPTIKFISSPTISPYPVLSSYKPNTAPSLHTTSSVFPSYPNNIAQSSYSQSTPSFQNTLTEADVNNIHRALHLFEVDSNIMSVVGKPTEIPSSNIKHYNNLTSHEASLPIINQGPPFRYEPPPSSTPVPSHHSPTNESFLRLVQKGTYVLI